MEKANKDTPAGQKWKPPPGYKSELAKARDAWKAQQKAEKDKKSKPKKVAALGAEDTASEDSDSDDDDDCEMPHICAALRRPYAQVHKGTPISKALVTKSGT